MSKWLRILLLCTLLAGCGTKFVYHHLDWFVIDYVEDFVDLDEQQKLMIEQAMPDLLEWHTREALPRYVEQIDELLALPLSNVTVEQIAQHQDRARAHYQQLVNKLLPDVTAIAATFKQTQIDQFMDAVVKRHEKFAKKYREMDEPALRQFYQEKVQEDLEEWLGPLTPEQKIVLKEWSLNIQSTISDWVVVQVTFREQIRALFEKRHQPEQFQAYLGELLLNSEQYYSPILKAKLAYNRGLAQRYLVEILRISTPKQQLHFRQELQDWKEIGMDLLVKN
ncbi:DUF6279 family lipoprotein [Vibrio sp. RC586]|uniref:DUF6279 family lipoprotein n=1 Tax=Vibrio sp. RC586 TaxID=675815 RepID=UPI0005107F39|nr:DUF6279 family lipoprotein [Vibrio sp. RC586]